MSSFRAPTILSLTLALACTSVPEADDEAGVTTSPSTGEDVDTNDSSTTSTTSTTGTSTGTSTTTSDDLDTTVGGFIVDDDIPGEQCMCDTWQQDCPDGDKCVPFSLEGGPWDCVMCVPVLGDQAAGESCVYDGTVVGTDDCDASSWCFTLEGEGICHAFCTGTLDAPVCPPGSQCLLSGNDGVINVCVAACDPILQNCEEGTACSWSGAGFTCVFVESNLPIGEPCNFVSDCALGLQCTAAAALPSCAGEACCAPFCEVGLGDAQCEGLPGTACVPFFEIGQAPVGYEHVGICVLPP